MTICTHCNRDVKDVCTEEQATRCACMLDEYRTLLKRHDWWYDRSEDYQVYARGKNQREKLRMLREKLDQSGDEWNSVCPEDFKVKPLLSFEVLGFTKTGTYADVVWASDSTSALFKGKQAIARLKPPSPIIGYEVRSY
jgi:hypothetical protein